MFNIVLYEPEIPPNTGNIIRLCANTGANLHLIEPLGFEPSDKQLKRAGLDYHDFASCKRYKNFDDFLNRTAPKNLYCLSTKGTRCYSKAQYQPEDFLMFGPETRGLPEPLLKQFENTTLRVPMQPHARSLNLSNTVAIVLYEAWRQLEFKFRG